MKSRILKILLIAETIIIATAAVYACVVFSGSKKTELFRETSPDGGYLLVIEELGSPDWPFGNDHLRVTLYGTEENSYRASFKADVANNGVQAGYEVSWAQNGVQIVLSGSEQPTAYYMMPFKTPDE